MKESLLLLKIQTTKSESFIFRNNLVGKICISPIFQKHEVMEATIFVHSSNCKQNIVTVIQVKKTTDLSKKLYNLQKYYILGRKIYECSNNSLSIKSYTQYYFSNSRDEKITHFYYGLLTNILLRVSGIQTASKADCQFYHLEHQSVFLNIYKNCKLFDKCYYFPLIIKYYGYKSK